MCNVIGINCHDRAGVVLLLPQLESPYNGEAAPERVEGGLASLFLKASQVHVVDGVANPCHGSANWHDICAFH